MWRLLLLIFLVAARGTNVAVSSSASARALDKYLEKVPTSDVVTAAIDSVNGKLKRVNKSLPKEIEVEKLKADEASRLVPPDLKSAAAHKKRVNELELEAAALGRQVKAEVSELIECLVLFRSGSEELKRLDSLLTEKIKEKEYDAALSINEQAVKLRSSLRALRETHAYQIISASFGVGADGSSVELADGDNSKQLTCHLPKSQLVLELESFLARPQLTAAEATASAAAIKAQRFNLTQTMPSASLDLHKQADKKRLDAAAARELGKKHALDHKLDEAKRQRSLADELTVKAAELDAEAQRVKFAAMDALDELETAQDKLVEGLSLERRAVAEVRRLDLEYRRLVQLEKYEDAQAISEVIEVYKALAEAVRKQPSFSVISDREAVFLRKLSQLPEKQKLCVAQGRYTYWQVPSGLCFADAVAESDFGYCELWQIPNRLHPLGGNGNFDVFVVMLPAFAVFILWFLLFDFQRDSTLLTEEQQQFIMRIIHHSIDVFLNKVGVRHYVYDVMVILISLAVLVSILWWFSILFFGVIFELFFWFGEEEGTTRRLINPFAFYCRWFGESYNVPA